MQNMSNITNRPFLLVTPNIDTIKIRRGLIGRGISAARTEVAMAPPMTNAFDDQVQTQVHEQVADPVQTRKSVEEKDVSAETLKGKLEGESVGGIVAGVKRLRMKDADPWESFNETGWDEERGRLYGRWDFEGQS